MNKLQAKLDALNKANNKYGNALLSGVGGTMSAGQTSTNAPPPSSDVSGTLLPAYQRLRNKIQITNSNMKIIEGSGNSSNSVSRKGSVTEVQQTSGERPVRQSVAENSGRWPTGTKLTSNSGQSSPRTLSARDQVVNDSNLTVTSMGQQPHPPLGDNTHSFEGAPGPAPNRKSLRRVTTDPSPQDSQQQHQQLMTPIVPGVPLLGKQTRDSLKERLVI